MTDIVVMEDSRTQAERLRLLLVGEGWTVRIFNDGQNGVDACIATPPDIVVSDVLMPRADGYEVCRRLAANESTSALPVVLLTSLGDPLDVVRALSAGAANFVTKPYRDEDLLARLRRTLETSQGGRRPISIRGEEVRVTASPERILDVLVSALEDAKARNEELARSHAALAISEANNMRLYREASEANRAKDEFLAVVSHELRTPLNAIVGWAALLREGGSARVDMKKAIETIERNARAQSRLIDDVLDASRITTGKLTIERRPVHLGTIVSDAVDSVRVQAASKGLELHLSAEANDTTLSGDPDRLNQVVLNLLSNAIKFTPSGGRVDVSLTRGSGTPNDCAVLSVKDTGKGISPTFLPHVFEQFRQADSSSSRQHSGLGLGLAIVKHLVELHGGTMQAKSEGVGRGAEFVVELPCAVTDAPDEDAQPRAVSPLDRLKTTFSGLRVLIVDDEDDAREVLTLILGDRGAEVRSADSAQSGYLLLDTFAPHVLISDIGMPGEDGLAFIARVRAHPLGKNVSAIALTAYTDQESANAAMRAGFDTHVAKPVAPEELLRAVAKMRRRA